MGVFIGTLFLFNIKEPKLQPEIDDEDDDEKEFNLSTAKQMFSHARNTFGYIWKHSSVLLLFA